MVSYRDEYELIKALHLNGESAFVSRESITQNLLPMVFVAVVSISLVYVTVLSFLKKDKRQHKAAYQVTNLLVNLSFGILGTYLDLNKIGAASEELEVQNFVIGYENVAIMACGQLGYNIWALPVGILLVDEAPQMIGHHIMVIFVASQAAFSYTGFRFFIPFMFGTMELSSVPLAIFNYLKERPELQKKFQLPYLMIRLSFCFSFLWIRIYMLLPRQWDYLRLHLFATLSSPSHLYRLYYGIVWIASFFLTLLQIWWAYLIVKGIFKFMIKTEVSAEKKKET